MIEMENIYCDPAVAGGIDVLSIRANDAALKAATDVIEGKLATQTHIADATDLPTCITRINAILDALETAEILAV